MKQKSFPIAKDLFCVPPPPPPTNRKFMSFARKVIDTSHGSTLRKEELS